MNTNLNKLTSIITSAVIALFILIGTQSVAKAPSDSEVNQQLAQVRRVTEISFISNSARAVIFPSLV